MSQPNIKQLKASDLSPEELRLQKAQQAIDDLLMLLTRMRRLKDNSTRLVAQKAWSR
jgi:hypothetical protein